MRFVPEVVKAHAYQFLLGEHLRRFASESSPPGNKVGAAFILPLFCLKQLWDLNPSLNVVELSQQFLLMMEPSGRFAYHVEAAPFKDCIKSYNIV